MGILTYELAGGNTNDAGDAQNVGAYIRTFWKGYQYDLVTVGSGKCWINKFIVSTNYWINEINENAGLGSDTPTQRSR